MKIEYHPAFKKAYKKRIASNPKLVLKVAQRINMFVTNPQNPMLCDHKLEGKLEGWRAFSIAGDIRIVYLLKNDTAIFLNIGSHNQVY